MERGLSTRALQSRDNPVGAKGEESNDVAVGLEEDCFMQEKATALRIYS
jgi:hypothetical protein